MNTFGTHAWTCQRKHGQRHCVRETLGKTIVLRETLRGETKKLQRCLGSLCFTVRFCSVLGFLRLLGSSVVVISTAKGKG